MLKILRRLWISSLFCTISVFASCGSGIEVIHILTDRKELASAAEMFDTANEDIVITIHQVPVIDAGIIEAENPDIIIGSHLRSAEIINLLRSPGMSFPVYEALSGPVDRKGNTYLTPLSFQLPLIMGRKSAMNALPDPVVVTAEDLREASLPETKLNGDGRLTNMGFSPSWNPLTGTDILAVQYPSAFEEDIENADEELLRQIILNTRDWVVETAGSLEADGEFNRRYRYIPDENLILQGRISFARTDFAYWAALPDTTAANLDIRYFSGPRRIPVTDVTSAALGAGSKSTGASRRFIAWLMLPETQERLLSRWERDGIPVFGIFGGLSSLPAVNNTVLLEYFPEMANMIPEGHYLSVPVSLPHRWPRIRDEVVAPWFKSAVFNTGNAESLADAYRKWDLSSLAETD